LAGEIDEGDTVSISAGTEGLIVGDRVSSSNLLPPQNAVVH
jgi:ATP-dependent Clp protease ATP-binding subunit ClpB